MSHDVRPLSVDTLRAIQHYEERLLEFAAASATYGHADPETALWNGRRVAEATCLIVLCVVKNEKIENVRGKSQGPKGLDELLKELDAEKQLVDPQRTLFENLQRSTNIGVHVRYDGRAMAGELTDQAHEVMRKVGSWLYEKSPAGPYLARIDRWREIDDKLTRATKSQPAPHQLIERLEDLLREITDQKTGLLLRAEAAEKRAQSLEKTLSDRTQPPPPVRADPAAAHPGAPSTPQGRRPNVVFLVTLALLVGLGAGLSGVAALWFLLPNLGPKQAGSPPIPPAHEPVVAVPASPPTTLDPATPAPGPSPAVDADNPCPSGFSYIPPTMLSLSQPVGGREQWPPADPAAILPFSHPGFCIATAPNDDTTPSALAACQGRGGGCLTRAEADEVCTREGGRLPSLADWEAVARADAPLELGRDREWVADPFPPEVLNRRGESPFDAMFRGPRLPDDRLGPDDLQWSWNQALSNNRKVQAGFRCVVQPTP